MDTLYREFYDEMLNIQEEINRELGMQIDFRNLKTEECLIAYIVSIVSKNGGRRTFTKLWSIGKLDLSLEYLVSKEKYKKLFSQEVIDKSKKTLYQYGYEI